MSAKIISSHRYKKTTRKKAETKKEQKYKYLNNKKKNKLKYIKEKQKKEKKYNDSAKISNVKNELNDLLGLNKISKSNNIYIPKSFKIVGLIFCLIAIAFLSKKIVSIEESPIVKVFSNKDEKDDFIKDYDLKVGISSLDTTNVLTSKNIVLKELETMSTSKLIEINQDYSITYLGASTIDKVSNKEYNVLLNEKYGITIEEFKNSVESIKNTGQSSIYYKYISNIESIEEISKKQFKIKLFSDNPYFVYSLDFPINSDKGKSDYIIQTVTDNSVSFVREDSKSTIKSINLSNYVDSDKMVEDFRNNDIDVFFTSSTNAMQLIRKTRI